MSPFMASSPPAGEGRVRGEPRLYIPMNATEGNLNAGDLRFGIVVSKFNEFVTGRLEAAAFETLKQHGAPRR